MSKISFLFFLATPTTTSSSPVVNNRRIFHTHRLPSCTEDLRRLVPVSLGEETTVWCVTTEGLRWQVLHPKLSRYDHQERLAKIYNTAGRSDGRFPRFLLMGVMNNCGVFPFRPDCGVGFRPFSGILWCMSCQGAISWGIGTGGSLMAPALLIYLRVALRCMYQTIAEVLVISRLGSFWRARRTFLNAFSPFPPSWSGNIWLHRLFDW